MNSFRDPTTGVLKAFGYTDSNEEGDLIREEAEDFSLRPLHWRLEGDEWVPNDPPPADMVVSPFQARAALLQAGLLDQVEALMAAPDTPRMWKLAWEKAMEFRRSSPLVNQLKALLGLNDADTDALFVLAATIEV